jgi:uncharacterized protein (DUF736 family)
MNNKENTGAIFKNTKKEKETQPDYKGTINVDGVEKEIALWIRTSQKGTTYMSAAISNPYNPQPTSENTNGTKPVGFDNGIDLPF